MEGTDACLKVGLDKLGITNPSTLYRNLTYQELFEHEQANKEGVVAKAEFGDTFTVNTGKFTGVCLLFVILCFVVGPKNIDGSAVLFVGMIHIRYQINCRSHYIYCM